MFNISKLVYALAFQAGWFACIMAGNFASIIYTALFLLGHFFYLARKNSLIFLRKEMLWVITVFCLGLVVETIYFSAGFLYTDAPKNLFAGLVLPPIWLLCVWLLFSLALRTCLSFLFYKPALSYLTCLLFVPINYYAGATLNNEVDINEPYFLSLALMTLIWILFFWCLIYLKRHYFEEIFNAD